MDNWLFLTLYQNKITEPSPCCCTKKSIDTDQCLHYNSNLKINHKEIEVYSLFNRPCIIISKKCNLRKTQ